MNPCDAVKLPRKGTARNGSRPKRMLFLAPPEVRTLAEAMPRRSERVAVYVAAYCGPRAGELWALRRRDIDLLHGTLRIERAVKEINTSAEQDKELLLGPTNCPARMEPGSRRSVGSWARSFGDACNLDGRSSRCERR